MKSFLRKVISKRSLLGTLLLIILIGEPTVGIVTGIFTLPGIIIFFFLYLTIFHLFESLIFRYNLVVYQVILLTFALYAIFITGFLNKELTEFILQPGPIPLLIRIQASFFVVFSFYLLNRIIPRNAENVLSIKQAIIFFTIFVLLMSLTGQWGIPSIIKTLTTVPGLSLLFIIMALIAVTIALKTKVQPTNYEGKKLVWVIYFYILMGSIPNLVTFLILLITMIFGGIYLLVNKNIRNSSL